MSRITISLLVCCIMCPIVLSAQMVGAQMEKGVHTIEPDYKLAVGIRGGTSISQWGFRWNGEALVDDISFASKIGWRVGIGFDLKIWRNLFLETGVYYSVKTTRFDFGAVWSTDDGGGVMGPYYPYYIFNPGYLEMPLIVSARFRISELLQLQAGFGAFVAYGLCGKSQRYSDFMDDYDNEEYLFRSKKIYLNETNQITRPSVLRPFDFGLCFNAGLKIKRFHFDVCYDLGLRAVNGGARDSNPVFKYKTRSISINLGYDFYVKK